ncbi:MAG: FMN-binding protein, partial [Eubacteriales bacterium]|nr:FMN-binding protein [Eubacteriales bacterium]
MKQSRRVVMSLLALLLTLCLALPALAQEAAGTAQGFGGEVSVTLTIEDGKIVAASATGDAETEGIGSSAIEKMPALMVAGGAVDGDGVAGATV